MDNIADRETIGARPVDTDTLTPLITDPIGDISPNQAKPTSEDCSGSIREAAAVSLPTPKKAGGRPRGKRSITVKEEANPRPPKPMGLTLKQRAFVDAYAKPDSPTFGNGTRSAIVAQMGGTLQTSAGYASALIRKPDIVNEITKTFKENRLTIEDRSRVLSHLLHEEHNVTEQLDKEGNVVSQVRASAGKLQLQAIREINRMSGVYAQADNIARAQRDAVQPLIAHYAQQLRQALKDEDESLRQSALQGTLEGLQSTLPGQDDASDEREEEAATKAGGGGAPHGVI
jgi:phage terminase small subunit